MSNPETIVLVLTSYLISLGYFVLLYLAMYNSYYFLYRQKKYKVYPLVLFYVLSIPCIVLRIYHSIWIIENTMYKQVLGFYGPAALKISIGII